MSQLTDLIEQKLNEATDKQIIKDLATDEWLTKQELNDKIAEAVQKLQELNVTAGDLVLISRENTVEHIIVYLAALKLRAVIYAVNPNMTAAELGDIINAHQYAALLLSKNHEQLVADHKLSPLTFEPVALTSKLNLWTVSGQTQTDELRPKLKAPTNDESRYAILLYTSGTTGKPKGVGLTHQQVYAEVQNVISAHRLNVEETTLLCMPLFHINAQVIAFLSTICSGGQIVLAQKFSASRFWGWINDNHVTWVSAAPAMISILLKRDGEGTAPSYLRFVRSASAPLAPTFAQEFEKRFNVPVIQSYGMTEAASQICVNPLPPLEHKVGSVGLPVGVELQIMDADDQPLPHNQIGEICIRGANVVTEYIEALNQDDFRNDWFHTGDVGYQDVDGYVFIVGRSKELINRSGDKISPYEIEDVIDQLPFVAQAAAVGHPDDLYGETVALYVMLTEDATQPVGDYIAQIKDYAQQKLSRFKWPTIIAVVDELPTSATGKIQRTKVKQLVKNHQLALRN
ncbi:AMP-binding protein [Lapidilactobacillus mulanensis]|uniref:AMP-binding protein n=1 Tax=Lapidilactobacillus mulanensis TaxID=2485999 RepID=A0ABW4DLW4_9LACO|nr:AMP-binding protein [Lapidilactobacillus mulanensis]